MTLPKRNMKKNWCQCGISRAVPLDGEWKCLECGKVKKPTPPKRLRERIVEILQKYGEWVYSDHDPHFSMNEDNAISAILSALAEEIEKVEGFDYTVSKSGAEMIMK